ncbi:MULTISPECIES: M23 family metallopeptidase [unclassified Ruegeria]|jgi:murein DD-endopeptidase MepM/ murein hydrolase activator NlpD|uniref:M23 family metallopeptidase n=1 Tax=unclassified Ruegeria TaxID=2625375 RepID=UPI001492889D|nr:MULTISPECIES: M23 family metallopeptidase [unclassified Ruegeria]NOD90790.1 peptidoglycan DD-metalloendopeptidase family protein [Ruegeria sp. HKCCD4318]NOE16092.1 peptidoglycan DD-metalloendopeptidase family protein [Ruegeria sp. HKCCD4318-2]NOG11655.1 M23 family metallopeptidase [Ruegeria sp. HKCCD4315]UUV08509.1 M23 family metallopeptidase [Ruegeria sp. YS9]
MSARFLATSAIAISSVSIAAIMFIASNRSEMTVPAPTVFQVPKLPAEPQTTSALLLNVPSAELAPSPVSFRPVQPEPIQAEEPLPPVEPPSRTWTRELAVGDTLDSMLSDAGIDATDRAEIALALGAEYDLRRLRPGHSITVVATAADQLRSVELAVEDGVRIEVTLSETLSTRVVSPEPDTVILARKTEIETSISNALSTAKIPVRFAVDLAQMLSGTVDFRRDLTGGEKLRLLWREESIDGEKVGQPQLIFAALEVDDQLYEIAWPDAEIGRAAIYVDGELLRVFSQPVEGARLSSVFGRRKHPVYGNVRMHTGVDFAAARGTPVHATAPGRVSYVGWRGGYGRVVEIAHGSDTVTRYTHLSATADGLAKGQRVEAGEVVGRVGSSGTATGPNLHYEVLVDGRPTDPLSDDRLAAAANNEVENEAARKRLRNARAQLEKQLGNPVAKKRESSS